MQTKRNRLFAFLLAVVMMLSVFPVSGFTAFADEAAAEQALWEGNGTEEKPYVLKTSEDLKLLSDSTNNDNKTYKDEYFSFENDITIPDEWTPIGTGSSRFSGNIDGNGFRLNVPSGSLSLIGTPGSPSVKNLKIYGEKIPGYGLVQNYTTSSAMTIDNVTILSGSHILYSGFIGGYGNTSVIIKNCTAEKGVVIGDDGSGFWGDLGDTDKTYPFVGKFNHQDNIGSFAGAFNGTISNCVSYATVYGRNNVGGIVGMKGQSMRDMYINSCDFYGEVIATGKAVGGIVGSGYPAASAPNSPCVTIQNCFSAGTVTGATYVGGIFGGEPTVICCWANGIGRIQNNLFTGTVTATDSDGYAGGIIGYMRSLDRYNIITNNYYFEESAKAGFGAVSKIDTACEAIDKSDESIEFVTTSQYARDDDPLGDDADKLIKAVSADALAGGTITELLNNGENSLKNWVQGTASPKHSEVPVAYKMTVNGTYKDTYYIGDALDLSNITITVDWSDGTKTTPAIEELTVTGFDSSTRGVQKITLSLGAASAELQVTVLKPVGADITVTVSVCGDYIHNEDENAVHTMKDGNLEKWVDETQYTVSNNATVWDVMQLVLDENNMTCSNPTGNYIKSITKDGNELGEFTNGNHSGWLYTLNGDYPLLGVSEQFLDDDSVIVFHYTDDYVLERTFAENKRTADDVVKLIYDIGNITVSSGNAIALARTAYDALTEEQQELVTNYSVLTDAEKAYAELIKANERLEQIYKSVGDRLEAIGTPAVGSIGGEWAVIGLARSGRNVSDEYYENVVNYVRENINDKEQLHKSKSTDNARLILALTSLGYDVSDVDGHNLLMGLTDFDYVEKQGINGPIWALIAFDSHGYEIPLNHNAKHQVTRENLIAAVLDAQLDDGGWSLSEDKSDADITAMAIQALAPYYDTDTRVKAALDDALECLSALQTPIGGYNSWDTLNSESCAQVIVALTALGIDPQTDSRFIKNGCSVLDALAAFYTGDGFAHTADGDTNGMATEQGYYALAAYYRLKESKTSLYDMSDVSLRLGENPVIADNGKPNNTTNSQGDNQVNNTAKSNNSAQDNSSKNSNGNGNKKSPQTGNAFNGIAYFAAIIPFAVLAFLYSERRKSKMEKEV